MSKILVVDDEYAIRLGLQYLLERDGYEVECAGDADSAFELMQKGGFDLAIVDLRMPQSKDDIDDESGIHLLERMDREDVHLPVIVLTVRDEPTALAACKKTRNCCDYLFKSPDPQKLRTAVATCAKSAASQLQVRGSATL